MNLSAFIARRWAATSPLQHTRNIIRMGIASMGLCVSVMVVSVCILVGFKQEISKKVFGFGSHVVIQPYWNETGKDGVSILWDSALQQRIAPIPEIRSAQPFALKGALIRGKEESYGVFFKGFPPAFDTAFFSAGLKKGRLPDFAYGKRSDTASDTLPHSRISPSDQILISEFLAQKLQIDTSDKLRAYFVHEGTLRPRAFTVCGIYATGLEKFDETYIICDIAQIQKINAWTPFQADGIDIRLENPDKRQAVAGHLAEILPYQYACFPCDLLFPEIFDWLALIDTNVWVLLIIMLIVCLICLISLLFILIIERRPYIGILKTMGASNRTIRKIFIRQTLFILGRGLLWGNVLALSIGAIQKISGIFRLDESVYYIDRVPVSFPWDKILFVNLIVVLAAALLLRGISRVLNRTSPARSVARGR